MYTVYSVQYLHAICVLLLRRFIYVALRSQDIASLSPDLALLLSAARHWLPCDLVSGNEDFSCDAYDFKTIADTTIRAQPHNHRDFSDFQRNDIIGFGWTRASDQVCEWAAPPVNSKMFFFSVSYFVYIFCATRYFWAIPCRSYKTMGYVMLCGAVRGCAAPRWAVCAIDNLIHSRIFHSKYVFRINSDRTKKMLVCLVWCSCPCSCGMPKPM